MKPTRLLPFLIPLDFWDHPAFSSAVLGMWEGKPFSERQQRVTKMEVESSESFFFIIADSLLQELEKNSIIAGIPEGYKTSYLDGRKVYYFEDSPNAYLYYQGEVVTTADWFDSWTWMLFDAYMKSYGKFQETGTVNTVLSFLLIDISPTSTSKLGIQSQREVYEIQGLVSALADQSFVGTSKARVPGPYLPAELPEKYVKLLQQHGWKP